MPAFTTVRQLVTGPGTLDQLGTLARPLGKHALLVTGSTAMKASGIAECAQHLLADAGIYVTVFDRIAGEPTDSHVDAARALCLAERCDLVIGLGGGSPIDAAKAVAALAHAPAPTAEYVLGRTADAARILPCIAVPTTSGTGAEVTPNAVIAAPAHHAKASIRGPGILPEAALVDPDLTLTCPPGVTATAGMDALTQAVESYVSIYATPLTDALALAAAELLLTNLLIAFRDGTDRPARTACSYAATIAGIALANARLGVVHGLAHPLGIRYHIPHGLCCAVLLGPSIRLNRASAPAKYGRLDALAASCGSKTIDAAAEKLLDRLGLPRTFVAYHLHVADFPLLAAESMPSGSLKANPRKITEPDLVAVLRQVAR